MSNACTVDDCTSNDNDNVKKKLSEISINLDIAFYLNRPLTNEEKVLGGI
jgi:hypothetical protein